MAHVDHPAAEPSADSARAAGPSRPAHPIPAAGPSRPADSAQAASSPQSAGPAQAACPVAERGPASSTASASAPAPDADAALRRTKRIMRWGTLAVLAAVVAVCLAVEPVRAQMGAVFALLSSGDIGAVVDWIRSFGPWAAAISFALMVLQSLAAPIPAFLITFANAAVFGWWQGALLSWTSAMAGAALCFWIARALGRDAVAHFASHGALEQVDRFFGRYGANAILVCRLLPFMSFDVVSYAAGLTGMGFWGFFWATGAGQLPATIVYSYVGGMLTGSAQLVMTALLVLFALGALAFLLKRVFDRRRQQDAGTCVAPEGTRAGDASEACAPAGTACTAADRLAPARRP